MKAELDSNILIPTSKGLQMEKLSNIVCALSEGSYSELILSTGDNYIISKNLSQLSALLPEMVFFRVHASVMINITHLRKIVGMEVIMSNNEHYPIAQRRKTEFFDVLRKNSLSL